MSLQSDNTRNIIDVIDKLRSQGINRYIDLPEIIVCGEQSSGKSSVLEAISGIKFPSKDNLCTRFATELILRKGPDAPVKIRIVPGSREDRSQAELDKLLNFQISVSIEEMKLDEIINSAKDAMGINDTSRVFSSDILRLEVTGKELPLLTLVDLPGLFQAGSLSQSDADSETVRSLVLSYMRRERSIILAVVSAKNDFNNQIITKYARDIDPQGTRTLGLITKPDTLDEGSDSERFYFRLAQNKDVKFRLGWHVLRNRDYASRNSSAEERNEAEAKFFRSGIWGSLARSQVGVHSLSPRLSKILEDHIVTQLPAVLSQVKEGIQECEEILKVLGVSRATTQEQRRYLLQSSQSFTSLVKAAIDGQYSDPFFGDASTDMGYKKRLRAVLQNTLTEFAAKMRSNGHKYVIIDEGLAKSPRQIKRAQYIQKVKGLLERSRGRELPGTFDPLIIGQLFHEQREPWTNLIDERLDMVLHATQLFTHAALANVCDQTTYSGLSTRFVDIRLEGLAAGVRKKVAELLKPHETGHPITYNHYLTENVQKAQNQRRMKEIRKTLESLPRVTPRPFDDKVEKVNVDIESLTAALVSQTEADMNNYASSTATDFMEAYYKVAMKKIIDDFSVLAVEECLIQRLPKLFEPADVLEIDDATVSSLASESEEASIERKSCNEKLKVLQEGLNELQSKSIRNFSSATQEPFIENHMNGVDTTMESKVAVIKKPYSLSSGAKDTRVTAKGDDPPIEVPPPQPAAEEPEIEEVSAEVPMPNSTWAMPNSTWAIPNNNIGWFTPVTQKINLEPVQEVVPEFSAGKKKKKRIPNVSIPQSPTHNID